MPFRRRYNVRKRRRRYYPRRRKDTVKKVRRTVNKIKRKIETKNYVVFHDAINVGATNTGIGNLQPGVSDNDVTSSGFIGKSYHCNGLAIQGICFKRNASNVNSASFRMICIWIKNVPIAGTVDFEDYYQTLDDQGTPATIPDFHAFLRPSQVKNVKILMDHKWSFGPKSSANDVTSSPTQFTFKRYLPINGPTNVDVVTTNLTRGFLGIWLIADADDQVQTSFTTKLYYKDP